MTIQLHFSVKVFSMFRVQWIAALVQVMRAACRQLQPALNALNIMYSIAPLRNFMIEFNKCGQKEALNTGS